MIIIDVGEALKMLGIILVLLAVLGLARNLFGFGVDDSDESKWNRSGFRVMTDHKTGVQYLSDGKGGLVRREY